MTMDRLVKLWLSETRLVRFVVSVSAIAVHIDDYIASVLLTKLKRGLRDKCDCKRIITIYMKDRRLDHFRHIRAVHRRTGVGRKCGKSNLIVNDHIHGPASLIASELREIQALRHNSLTG